MARQALSGQAQRRHGDALEAVAVGAQRVEHQPVVGAVHADLDQHAVGRADAVEHAEIGRGRCGRRRVGAALHEGVLGRQADDVGVRVDGALRHGEAGGTARVGIGPGAGGRGTVIGVFGSHG